MYTYVWDSRYQTKARNPENTVAATNLVFDSLMTSDNLTTSYDLKWPPKWKCFNYGFMHIQQKLGTQGIQQQQQVFCYYYIP